MAGRREGNRRIRARSELTPPAWHGQLSRFDRVSLCISVGKNPVQRNYKLKSQDINTDAIILQTIYLVQPGTFPS